MPAKINSYTGNQIKKEVSTLRTTTGKIREAVAGNMREHLKFIIQSFFDHIKNIEEIIEKINREIDDKLKPYFEEYELLQTIPGIRAYFKNSGVRALFQKSRVRAPNQ